MLSIFIGIEVLKYCFVANRYIIEGTSKNSIPDKACQVIMDTDGKISTSMGVKNCMIISTSTKILDKSVDFIYNHP
jgi:hypothetical protein